MIISSSQETPSLVATVPVMAEGPVICVDPETDPRWHRLVEEHRASSVFHSPAWLQVLRKTYGIPVRAYVLIDPLGEPTAGIPFVRISDFLGTRVLSLAFSDYCDPLVRSQEEWKTLSDHIVGEGSPVLVRCLHNRWPLEDPRFTLIKQAKWHEIDLRPNLDTLWEGFDGAARRAVRKAQKDGVVVRQAEDEKDLRAFFEMHLGIRKWKYRLLAQPYGFFENIWRCFLQQGKGALMLARHEDRIIGGVMFLEWKDTFYYKFNSSRPEYLSHRPNDLVIWEGIQYAKARGYTKLDFGLSDWEQDELVRYKRKYASEEGTIFFMRYGTHGTSPEQQELRQLLPQLTELFTDSDVANRVTERAGDLLYRFFA